MGKLSPEQIMFLVGSAVLALALVVFLVRRLARGRRPDTPATAVIPAQARSSAEVHTLRPQQATPQPNTAPRPAPPQAAPQPSYTTIAVAEASRFPPKSAAVLNPARIDYANEATSVSPGASYAAIAVANAARATRGLPPLEISQPHGYDNGNAAPANASYTEIAIAAAGQSPPRETAAPPQQRIDYSDVPNEILASASYTSIAVAAAARHA